MMSSLYIGATGMKTQGSGMGVISQNLSNVSTLGYKQLSMQYSDLMSRYMTASSGNITGTSQMGLGVATGSVRTLFTQGGVEVGSSSTDLYIDGQGFFGVTRDGAMHYTRAGNLRFDKDGALLDPSGWNVVGRAINNGVVGGAAEPIQLDMAAMSNMKAQASTKVSLISNLGGLEDRTAAEDNPFFGLASAWNGLSSPSLPADSYSHSEPVQFYDSNGTLRTATLYYDLAGKSGGNSAVEYVLGMNPEMDASALGGTSAAGLLMAGTITFASDGSMVNMSAFSPPTGGDPTDLSAWTPAPVQNGKAVFTPQYADRDAGTVALDMGFSFGAQGPGAGFASAADATSDSEKIYAASGDGTVSDTSSVMLGNSPANITSNRDGYAVGSLRDVVVGSNGVIRGVYSNGQEQELYQISLYRFTSQDGLRHEGGNHYSATPESGPADEGLPGEENFGSINSNALEQSNVDYAREFSLLIITQRGFQMNSKVITTSDSLLQKALELKR